MAIQRFFLLGEDESTTAVEFNVDPAMDMKTLQQALGEHYHVVQPSGNIPEFESSGAETDI